MELGGDLEQSVGPGSGKGAERRRDEVDPDAIILVGHYGRTQASHRIH